MDEFSDDDFSLFNPTDLNRPHSSLITPMLPMDFDMHDMQLYFPNSVESNTQQFPNSVGGSNSQQYLPNSVSSNSQQYLTDAMGCSTSQQILPNSIGSNPNSVGSNMLQNLPNFMGSDTQQYLLNAMSSNTQQNHQTFHEGGTWTYANQMTNDGRNVYVLRANDGTFAYACDLNPAMGVGNPSMCDKQPLPDQEVFDKEVLEVPFLSKLMDNVQPLQNLCTTMRDDILQEWMPMQSEQTMEIVEIIKNVMSELEKYCGTGENVTSNLDRQLSAWMQHQRLSSTGSERDIKDEEEKLEKIGEHFNEIAKMLDCMFIELNKSRQKHSAFWEKYADIFEKLYQKCQNSLGTMFKDLLLLSIQPPPLLVKNSRDTKKSKNFFSIKIRLIGASALLLENGNGFSISECELVSKMPTENFAINRVYSIKSCDDIVAAKTSTSSTSIPNVVKISTATATIPTSEHGIDSQSSYTPKDQKCHQCEFKMKCESMSGGSGKREMLYKMQWTVKVQLKHDIKFSKQLCSFPFHIWTINNDSELDAVAFLERIFGSIDVAADIKLMQDALEMKFRAVATKPLKETNEMAKSNSLRNRPIAAFTPGFRDYLIRVLGTNPTSETLILPKKYKDKGVLNTQEGDPVQFCDWFMCLPKLIAADTTPFYYNLWKNGLIWFCGKKEAEEHLRRAGPGTFMVRVSQGIKDCFKISSLRMDVMVHFAAFFTSSNHNELLIVQMLQHYKHRYTKKILKWTPYSTEVQIVDFAEMLKNIDENEYRRLMHMPEVYEPSKGLGASANDAYHANQKPFSTDAYLRMRWLLEKFSPKKKATN